MKVKTNSGAYAPDKAHKSDAGFDLFTPYDFEILPNTSVNIDTGVCVEVPFGYAGFVKSKSGLMCKHNIIAGEGVIDCGYSGSIVVHLENHGKDKYFFYAGNKIAQLVIAKISEDSEIEIVDEIASGERGENGFGSSGR